MDDMLELSQLFLVVSTILVTLGLAAYLVAVISARGAQRQPAEAKQQVLVESSGAPSAVSDGVPAEGRRAAAPARQKLGVVWFGSKLVQLALVFLTTSLVTRTMATGHAPFANHFEFAVSFAWGMTLAYIYFEWRYQVRTLALVVLPVILGMLLYASTLSYEANPLMPALQNSPLLTLHVFTAALAYGAAVIAFGAAVMFLIEPKLKWQGLPKPALLDEIGYKAVVITFPMLTIMIILGAIWANIAWGQYWSWDPKETAALVTWLIYGAYLHARVVRGWRGRRAAWLLVAGFAAILFTYFGNLFFGGLHSYV